MRLESCDGRKPSSGSSNPARCGAVIAVGPCLAVGGTGMWGRDREEVHRDQRSHVVGEEGGPIARRRTTNTVSMHDPAAHRAADQLSKRGDRVVANHRYAQKADHRPPVERKDAEFPGHVLVRRVPSRGCPVRS